MRRKSFPLLICCALLGAALAKPVAGGTPCVEDGLEDDDSIAQATEIESGDTFNAANCDGGDVFTLFSPSNALEYKLTVTPEPSHYVLVEWLDDDGTVLHPFDPGSPGQPVEIGPAFQGFDHVFYYRVRGAASSEGNYTISLSGAPTPLKLTAVDSAVTDDLDWLDPDAESKQMGTGWMFREVGNNSDPRANFLYLPDDGDDPEADTYSYGTGASTERAFGTLGEGTGLHPRLILFMRNETGGIIGSLDVSFTGEQWRLGAPGGVVDRLDAGYRFPNFVGDTYTDADVIDFTSPNDTATAGALDGNVAANRAAVSGTLSGLDIPDGGYFFLQWTDADVEGLEDGLAIDDLSITAHAPPPDADGDGVPDGSDLCPATPTGEGVDEDGCSSSQLDDDLDGVSNDVDQCPNSHVDDDVGADGCAWNLTVTIAKGKGIVFNDPDASEINCGLSFTDCAEQYPSNAPVTLTVKPKRGWRFVKWGSFDSPGPCAGLKAKTCTFNIYPDSSVQAIFKKR